MSLSGRLEGLSDRQRRLFKVVGYPGFGALVFLLSLYASVPRERLRELAERELTQRTGMEVSIGDLGLSLVPPGVSLRDVTLKERPAVGPGHPEDKEAKPRTYSIESIDARAALFDLLGGAQGGKLALSGMGGEAHGAARLAKDEARVQLQAKDIALAQVPFLAQAAPLPVSGALTLSAEFNAPVDPKSGQPLLSGSGGHAELSLQNGQVGDGKAKLTVPGDPFLSQGLTFPKVRLGQLSGRVDIKKGRATLEGLRASSPDLEASVEGYIDLRDPWQMSELHLYLRFRPSPGLVEKEPIFGMVMEGLSAAKRTDGFLGFAVMGPMANPRAMPAREPPAGGPPPPPSPRGGPPFGGPPFGGPPFGGQQRPPFVPPRGRPNFNGQAPQPFVSPSSAPPAPAAEAPREVPPPAPVLPPAGEAPAPVYHPPQNPEGAQVVPPPPANPSAPSEVLPGGDVPPPNLPSNQRGE